MRDSFSHSVAVCLLRSCTMSYHHTRGPGKENLLNFPKKSARNSSEQWWRTAKHNQNKPWVHTNKSCSVVLKFGYAFQCANWELSLCPRQWNYCHFIWHMTISNYTIRNPKTSSQSSNRTAQSPSCKAMKSSNKFSSWIYINLKIQFLFLYWLNNSNVRP